MSMLRLACFAALFAPSAALACVSASQRWTRSHVVDSLYAQEPTLDEVRDALASNGDVQSELDEPLDFIVPQQEEEDISSSPQDDWAAEFENEDELTSSDSVMARHFTKPKNWAQTKPGMRQELVMLSNTFAKRPNWIAQLMRTELFGRMLQTYQDLPMNQLPILSASLVHLKHDGNDGELGLKPAQGKVAQMATVPLIKSRIAATLTSAPWMRQNWVGQKVGAFLGIVSARISQCPKNQLTIVANTIDHLAGDVADGEIGKWPAPKAATAQGKGQAAPAA